MMKGGDIMTGTVTVKFRPGGSPDEKPDVYEVNYHLIDEEVIKAVEFYVTIRAQSAMRGHSCPKFITGWKKVS
jgi:hypothetical protein